MKKKILNVFLGIMIFAGSFFGMQQRAQAVVPLIIAGAAVGAGGVSISAAAATIGPYVISGLLVAGGGAFIADEYGDEIQNYSSRLYNDMSAAAKTGLEQAIAASVEAGKNTVDISGDFLNEMAQSSQTIADWIKGKVNTHETTNVYTDTYSLTYQTYSARVAPKTGYYLYANGKQANSATYQYNDSKQLTIFYGTSTEGNVFVKNEVVNGAPAHSTITSIASFSNVAGQYGLGITLKKAVLESDNYDALASINSSLATLAAASQVGIPNIGVRDTSGDVLSYNPTKEAWEDAKTGTVVTGADVVPVFDYPLSPADATYLNPAIPIENVIVGDVPFTGTTAGDIADAGIAANVASIATSLTTGLVGNPSNINRDKLETSFDAFTTSFPFSLPWDVGRALNAVFGDMGTEKPEWDIKSIFNSDESITVGIPDYFDDWMPFVRNFILISFDIGLVYAIYRLFGGAS